MLSRMNTTTRKVLRNGAINAPRTSLSSFFISQFGQHAGQMLSRRGGVEAEAEAEAVADAGAGAVASASASATEVARGGVEPPTFGLGSQRWNSLSYRARLRVIYGARPNAIARQLQEGP